MTNSVLKKIYFSVMALAMVLLLVFSFVTYYVGGGKTNLDTVSVVSNATELSKYVRSPYDHNSGMANAAAFIKNSLTGSGLNELDIKRAGDREDSSDYTKITNVGDARAPSFVVQDFAAEDIDYGVDEDTCYDMSGGTSLVYGAKQPKNFIAIIPGTDSKAGNAGDAVLFMTHYDSMPASKGGTNAVNVAAMLEVIKSSASKQFANDLVFVFTDGRYEDSVSAFAFKNQFVGFDKIYTRIKAAFNFDAITAGGNLSLVQSCEDDAAIVSAYVSCAGTTFSNSAVSRMPAGISSDFDIFYNKSSAEWEVPSLNFMFANGKYEANSKYDFIGDGGIDADGAAVQALSLMDKLSSKFGDLDLSNMMTEHSAAFSSYLGSTTAMPSYLAYVFSSLLILLIAGVIFIGIKKKAFGGLSVVKGVAIAVGTAAASIGIFYAAYFLIGLLLFCFGTIALEMIFTMQILSAGVLIPAILFAAAVTCGMYPLLKRSFRTKATDCVRGNAIFIAIFAAIFGYIVPAASLWLYIIGYSLICTTLILVLIKKLIKEKFNVDVERFMPYAWAMMFALPFVIPFILSISNFFSLIFLPVTLGAIAVVFGSITPYFDYLQLPLSKAFAKLPTHKIRVEEEITREVEDKAKKGKFETVTTREIITRDVKWKYHNWFGVTAVCTVTAVALIICGIVSSFGSVAFGNNVTKTLNFTNDTTYESIYSNSMIYYVEKNFSESSLPSNAMFIIKDSSLYTKARTVTLGDRHFINEFKWNDEMDAYTSPLTYEESQHPIKKDAILCRTGSSASDRFSIAISPYATVNSQVVLTIDDVKSVDKIVVSNKTNRFSMTYDSAVTSLKIVLPYGFGSCTLDLYSTSMNSAHIKGTEYIFNSELMRASEVTTPYMNSLDSAFAGINYGMIVNYSGSVSK